MRKVCPKCGSVYCELDNYCTKCGIALEKNPISALSKERRCARIGCLKTMTFTVRTAAPWGADRRLYYPESANALCVEEEAGGGEVSSSVK